MTKFPKPVIFAVLILAILIIEPFRMEPPTPNVTVNGKEIPTTQGSYCWRGIIISQCVDFIHTTPLDMAKEHNPTLISPQEKIGVDFRKEPLSGTLVIEQWIDENNIKEIELINDSISTPQEKGIYVYHIKALWKEGDGNYAFSVVVE
ncbi:hypothetical protein [Planomicrobium okeanokoites]|uniref:hypothetical protein n=1 Tax=Planomicrobium okeanokoites TaxID=244 RepID=UPI0030F9CF7A